MATRERPPFARTLWHKLSLPEKHLDALSRIVAHVSRPRRVGCRALFTGPSGTGKTMAAKILAKAVRCDLHRVDLSAILRNYVGETEKNLERLFTVAEAREAILFFDEADVLFGKHTKVKDSRVRYANLEIVGLLKRLESYHGLVIFAANRRENIDTAFLRRIRFVVNSPAPARKPCAADSVQTQTVARHRIRACSDCADEPS